MRSALLAGAGVAAVGVTSTSLADSAQAASVPLTRPRLRPGLPPGPALRARRASRTSTAPIQWEWAWCSKCAGLWYSRIGGNCPKDHKAHGGAVSYNYGVFYDAEPTPGYQEGWAFCAFCSGMFYANGNEVAGKCPYFLGGQGHQLLNSYAYVLFYGPGSYSNLQPGWLWCSQCEGMFYGGSKPLSGVCPANARGLLAHNGSNSYKYQMYDNL